MPGRFWRGNLHTHSTNSDGNLSPAETVAWYRDSGYDFVAMTDHCIGRSAFRSPTPDRSAPAISRR